MSDGPHHQQSSLTARAARWSGRHRWLVVIAWLVTLAAAIFTSSAVGADTDIEQDAPGESGEGFALYDDRFGATEESTREVIVFSHPTLTVDDPAYQQYVEGLVTELRALRTTEVGHEREIHVTSTKRVVAGTLTAYDIGLPRDASPFVAMRESAGDVSFAIVSMVGDAAEAEHTVSLVTDAVDAADGRDGFVATVGGEASIENESARVIDEDFGFALMLNLPITLLLLLFAFRALVAALIPLVLGLTAIATASGILALVSQAYPLSEIYSEMVLLMGLATGIDYSLFIITRYRGERAAGHPKDDAITLASGTSGKAVVFAGLTVLLAISGMFLVGDVIFSSLALSAVVVVAVAVVVSVTLLPALLAILGDNVDRGRLWMRPRSLEGGGIWGRISDNVLARPVTITVAALVALVLLALPLATLNLGFNGAKSLPNAVEAKDALRALEENFTLGLISPAIVIVDAGQDGNIFGADVQQRIDALRASVTAETSSPERPDAPYGAPVQVQVNEAGNTAELRIPINADTGEQEAIDAVEHLRNDLVPAAFDGEERVLVTGETAANIDFRENILAKTPLVVAFVIGLSFLVLLVAFRSIVIPIKAVILNALSVGAAYGILVLVFQEGFLLERPLDFEATGIIESWLPLFLFSILFGLSMDYHMFVMGRIKEAHEHGAPTDEAISIGIKATAGTITSAAAVMVAVAMIFAFTRFLGLKQFGFGLATAIFIDATVIRSVLLPASMKLLGPANWYLPSWLRWLPSIRMEESVEAGTPARQPRRRPPRHRPSAAGV